MEVLLCYDGAMISKDDYKLLKDFYSKCFLTDGSDIVFSSDVSLDLHLPSSDAKAVQRLLKVLINHFTTAKFPEEKVLTPAPGIQLVESIPPKVHKYNLNHPEDCLGTFAQYGVMSADNFKRDYLGAQPSKEKSEVTRPLTKEEAKLKRQETQAGATLKQVSFVVDRVTEIISQGASEFGLVEELLPESITAVKEVFPFVKLTQAPKSETYQPSTGRLVTVEFVD